MNVGGFATGPHPELELSAYVDGELAGEALARIEAHVLACDACRASVDDLRAVTTTARALVDARPATDLWPGIARRIGAVPPLEFPQHARRQAPAVMRIRRAGWRISLSWPQLLAAAACVAVLSGGAVWWGLTSQSATIREAGGLGGSVQATAADYEIQRYDSAVADLQAVLDHNHDRLDPETVRTVESNLAIIDAAIAQARRALLADPSNPYLNGHLADQMKRKIRVLQQTADAVTADYTGPS